MIYLAKISNDALPEQDRVNILEPDYIAPPRVKNYEPPRVKNDEHQKMRKLNDLNQPKMSTQPTSPQVIQQTPLTHQCTTRNNKPAIIPPNNDINLIPPRRSSWIHAQTPHIISQEAINSLTMLSQNYAPQFTPRKL